MTQFSRHIVVLLIIIPFIIELSGQSASFGNTFIHHKGEAVVFGNHDFDNGGAGVIPGLVGTERDTSFGIFGFSDQSTSWTNAANGRFVDGYVRTYSSEPFVFPIGDNGRYRPMAIDGGAGTTAAYFNADPDNAMTDDLFGGTYSALPIGGPFPTDEKKEILNNISQVEYWDIDGTEPVNITLTWDVFSSVNQMTGGDVSKLTIVAWDGVEWIPLPSDIDFPYLNNSQSDPTYNAGVSNRLIGSISTTAPVVPDSYIAYTLGAVASGFIGDFIWEDLNRNGIQEAGEPGIAGVPVNLYDAFTDQFLETNVSDANGRYVFERVPPGRYYLRIDPPSGYQITLLGEGLAALNNDLNFANNRTAPFDLAPNAVNFGLDAGFYKTGFIGDLVWLDVNGDGIQDGGGEIGVPDMRVELLGEDGNILAATVTDEDGIYGFTNLPPGLYFVRIELDDSYGYAPYRATLNDDLDSDIDPIFGRSDTIEIISGLQLFNIDIGLSQSCEYTAVSEIMSTDCGMTNGSIEVTVTGSSGPYEYEWSTGGTGPSISNLDTGVYTLIIRDSRGCTRVFVERVDYTEDCSMVCATLDAQVFLEGSFDLATGEMTTLLNELGYLPGQTPTTFFGSRTDPGQPYNRVPFYYGGIEGIDWESQSVGENNRFLSENMTDWVLVSLRVDPNEEYETCTRAGMLMKDGTIQFIEESCCLVDPRLDYYVVVEHRNHLIVMSPTPMPVVNDTIKYDFRNNASYRRLLGFTQKTMPSGVNAMYAANGDQYLKDQSPVDINVDDVSEWLEELGLNSSYFFMDFDLNGDVNVQDKIYYLNNIGVFTDVPKSR